MQQRQLRLGDVLDDYCPRERRLTNHAVVAMVGDEVKQTRCTTCDAEHEYKHAKVPRARKKSDLMTALAGAPVPLPKKLSPAATVSSAEPSPSSGDPGDPPGDRNDGRPPVSDIERATGGDRQGEEPPAASLVGGMPGAASAADPPEVDNRSDQADAEEEPEDSGAPASHEGPAHRRLIRATLPRIEGQPPQIQRQAPDFTIRQPAGARPGRFRPRPGGRGPEQSQGRSQGFDRHASGHGGPPRHGERQHGGHRPAKQQGFNRKRSK